LKILCCSPHTLFRFKQFGKGSTENQKVPGRVSTLWKQTSTSKHLSLSKNLQVEKKSTQVTMNSSSLSYFAKPTQQTTQKPENSYRKESPTWQVVRLTRYRSNFPSLNHSQNGSSVGLYSFLKMVTTVSHNSGSRRNRERRQNLTYIDTPVRQA